MDLAAWEWEAPAPGVIGTSFPGEKVYRLGPTLAHGEVALRVGGKCDGFPLGFEV